MSKTMQLYFIFSKITLIKILLWVHQHVHHWHLCKKQKPYAGILLAELQFTSYHQVQALKIKRGKQILVIPFPDFMIVLTVFLVETPPLMKVSINAIQTNLSKYCRTVSISMKLCQVSCKLLLSIFSTELLDKPMIFSPFLP